MSGSPPLPGSLVIRGRAIAPGLACGPLRRNRPDLTAEEAAGCVLLADRAVPDDIGRVLASAGTLTLTGTVLSHVSLLSREFGKPSIALSGVTPARLSRPEESGVLVLEDVVGGGGRAVLNEGDVALLDGGRGMVTVPGGVEPASRASMSRLYGPLAAFGKLSTDDAVLDALVDALAREPGGLAFLLEAALLYRLVPAGRAARRLLEAIGKGRRSAELTPLVAGLVERVLGEAASRCDEALVALAAVDDIEELQTALRDLEAGLERQLRVLEDLGGDPDRVEQKLEPVLAAAAERREVLERKLREDVAHALDLPDAGIRSRLGGLFRLLRRARAARFSGDEVDRLQQRLGRELAAERARAGTHLVVPLAPGSPRERWLVGGKAQSLVDIGDSLPAGCRMPRGFVVTSAAYRLHLLGETGEKLRVAVDAFDENAVSRKARAAILAGEIPAEIRDAVATALRELGAARLAVRSSATIEDGPIGSLAGLFDTYLGVSGLEEVLERLRWAWASLWNARALAALAATGLSPLRAAQAVVVQEIVETRAAGVLFSRDPTGRPDTVLINASWGSGEAISQGEVEGDLFWVRRSTGEPIAAETGRMTTRIELAREGIGTVEIPLAPAQRGTPCLGRDDLRSLAALARELEEATGRAQDVEFGVDEDGLVVFQVRRIVPRRLE